MSFETKLNQRLIKEGLLVEYTPEQEAEQNRWRSPVFKRKFPGTTKRKPKPVKQPAVVPDPFDTKPVEKPPTL